MKEKQTRFYFRFMIPVLMLILALSVAVMPTVTAASNATIDINTSYQTLEGFGAAIAWMQNYVTEHPYKYELYDLLFNGLGLDILRLQNYYRNTNNFDFGATEIVKTAGVSLGHPIKTFVSSWSPPASIKSGNTENGGTLIQVNGAYDYASFANYWYNSLLAYKNNKGFMPDYISIQNEPDFETTYASMRLDPTEGAYGKAGYPQALDAVYNKIQSLSPVPKILAPECTGLANSVIPSPMVQNYVKNLDLSHFYGIAHHLYNGGDPNTPDTFVTNMTTVAAAYPNKPLFQTEYDKGTPFTTASLMINSLVSEGVVSYMFWELVWDNTGNPLIKIENYWDKNSWSTTHGYTVTDFYYVFKQFCKFTDPGFKRILASSDNSAIKLVSFASPDKTQITTVLVNTGSSETSMALNFGSSFTVSNSAVYRTIPGGTDKFASVGSLGSGNTVTLPAQSVVTVVAYNASHVPAATPPPVPTSTPVPTSFVATNRIEAEAYSGQQNTRTGIVNDAGNRCVGYIQSGSYVVYNNVNFNLGVSGFTANLSTATSGGNIEIRLDSNGGTLLGTLAVGSGSDWYAFNQLSCPVSATTGTHNLYLVFTGGSGGYLFNLDWFQFTGGDATPTPTNRTATATPTPTTTPSPTARVTPTPTRRAATPTPTQRVTPTVTRRVTPSPTSLATPTPTRAATPTPTRAGTPTPTSVPGGYVVTYSIQSDWGTGATVNVTIKNNTALAVNGWTLAFTFPGNQTIANLWNGTYTQSGASVSVKDAGHNATIGANGGSVSFGFNLNYSGTNAKPTSFTLNGTACTVQ